MYYVSVDVRAYMHAESGVMLIKHIMSHVRLIIICSVVHYLCGSALMHEIHKQLFVVKILIVT